jgi:hypothetical protein
VTQRNRPSLGASPANYVDSPIAPLIVALVVLVLIMWGSLTFAFNSRTAGLSRPILSGCGAVSLLRSSFFRGGSGF